MQTLFQEAKLEFLKNEAARYIGLMSDLECRMRLFMDNPGWDSDLADSKAARFRRELATYSREMEEVNREFEELTHEIQKL